MSKKADAWEQSRAVWPNQGFLGYKGGKKSNKKSKKSAPHKSAIQQDLDLL